jgi:DNA-binding NarL/FixJ family response regulator
MARKQAKKRIVLTDHHPVVRQGIKALLRGSAEFKVVGEAVGGPAILRLVKQLRPDVLVLDLVLTGLHGLETIAQLRRDFPRTHILIFSMHASAALAAAALQKGATSYVAKGCESDVLIKAIRATAAGRRFLGPPLTEAQIKAHLGKHGGNPIDLLPHLTPREWQVLKLAVEGYTSRQIAGFLHLSPRTIEMHRANLMHKLGLRTQNELVRYALRRGITALGE